LEVVKSRFREIGSKMMACPVLRGAWAEMGFAWSCSAARAGRANSLGEFSSGGSGTVVPSGIRGRAKFLVGRVKVLGFFCGVFGLCFG